MCNTKNKNNTDTITQNTTKNNSTVAINDYKFIDYRLTQLENKLEKGLYNLEQEQRRYNTDVMKTLQTLQLGQSKTGEAMAKVQQRINTLEQNQHCIEKLKDAANKNITRIEATNHRIDVVQKILFAVGGAAVSALFAAAFSILQLLLLR